MKQILLIAIGFLFLGILIAQKTSTRPPAAPSARDPSRIRTGTFTYRDLDHGKEVGRSTIAIHPVAGSGNYDFVDHATFATEFKGYSSQQWEAVATPRFEPVSAKLAFVRGAEVVPIFELSYNSGRVTGYVIDRNGSCPGTRRALDASVPADTVDQRIDWAAVLASNLQPGQQFEFNVYDPGTAVSHVVGQVGEIEQLKIQAGAFPAHKIVYRIEKIGKTETYEMLASQSSPRMMLREVFPNGVISELVQISESAGQP